MLGFAKTTFPFFAKSVKIGVSKRKEPFLPPRQTEVLVTLSVDIAAAGLPGNMSNGERINLINLLDVRGLSRLPVHWVVFRFNTCFSLTEITEHQNCTNLKAKKTKR